MYSVIKWMKELQTLEPRIVIVLAGAIDFDLNSFLLADDIIIAVDGGANHLIGTRFKPTAIIGDLDSISENQFECPVIEFDPVKDDTDFACSLNYIQNNYHSNNIIVIGFASLDRIDHVLSNLSNFQLGIKFISNNQIIEQLENSFEVVKSDYKYYSFYATETINQFSLSGFKYDLIDYRLMPFDPLCISNELIADSGTIKISNGKIIMIRSKQS